MVKEVIYGTDIQVFMNGILIACGQSISVKSTRKEISTTCAGTGDVDTARVGKAKHSFTVQGLWRYVTTTAEAAANVTAYEMWTAFLAGAEVTIELKKVGVASAGEVSYLGVGFIKDMGMDGQVDEAGKTDVSGFFNTFSLTRTALTA